MSLDHELLLVIDPGQATGWSLWEIPDDAPIRRIAYGLIENGIDGFLDWLELYLRVYRPDHVACENFIPQSGPIDITARELIGALKAHLRMAGMPEPYMQLRSEKRAVGDASRRTELLKREGLWLQGGDVDWEDGRDVNDTALHALAWAKERHEPTAHHFWPKPSET